MAQDESGSSPMDGRIGMPAPHKVVLKDLLERFELLAERLEAAVVRLEGLEPPTALIPPTDPAAQEAADKYIEQRRHELLGDSVD